MRWLFGWNKKHREKPISEESVGDEGEVPGAVPGAVSGAVSESVSEGVSGEGYPPEGDAIVMEIDGVLDLHTFHPREVKKLVPDYLEECQKCGVLDVRIIHGKGQGTLRRIVQSILDKHPAVSGFQLGGHGSGGWGATLVRLHPLPDGQN